MADLGHFVTWSDLDPKFIFKIDLKLIYITIRFVETKRLYSYFSDTLISDTASYLQKNYFAKKIILSFDDIWSLNYWPEVKPDGDATVGNFITCPLPFEFVLATILTKIMEVIQSDVRLSPNMIKFNLW